jgi:hypothetical protein
MPLSAIRYKSVEPVIARTKVADSGCWIILGGVLEMALIRRWGASASGPEPPLATGQYAALFAG